MKLGDPVIDTFLIISFFSFIPAVLIMFTSFTRIVIVLSFLRQAIGGQQIPPNQVIIGLALFLTFFVMAPTFDRLMQVSLKPYLSDEITLEEAFHRAASPIKGFMLKQTRESDIALMLRLAGQKPPEKAWDLGLRIVVPAFVVSELKTAFEIGFLLFLPFVIIDLVVSSILLSLGMMMLPPVLISLPFKLILFVLVDGWHLVVGSLVRSFL